eukprot:g4970.t1
MIRAMLRPRRCQRQWMRMAARREARALSSAKSTGIRLLETMDDVDDALRSCYAGQSSDSGAFAFYSTALDGIVTQRHLMVMPLDDHMVHRGHCVFDTANVHDGKVYGLTLHLERLLRSAEAAKIDHRWSLEDLRTKVLETVAAAGRKHEVFVRYWLSAGYGDFDVSPKNVIDGAQFYCVAHADSSSHTVFDVEGRQPLRGMTVNVPLKPPLLARIKSNNYLLNALIKMEAESSGDVAHDVGVQFSSTGEMMESAVSSVVVVREDGVMAAPPTDGVLDSITLRRLFDYAGPQLVEQGLIQGCSHETVTRADVENAQELIEVGGSWIWPIGTFDGRPVGATQEWAGPVFAAAQTIMQTDFYNVEMLDDVQW